MKFLTLKFNFKLGKDEKRLLQFLTFVSKNIYNTSLYTLRQHFFTKKNLMSFNELVRIVKENENYYFLDESISLNCIKLAFTSMKNFINYSNIKLPKYLHKKSFFPLITKEFKRGFLNKIPHLKLPLAKIFNLVNIFEYEFKDEEIKNYLKMTKIKNIYIKIPEKLYSEKIYQLKIIPEYNATFFSVALLYENKITSTYKGHNTMAIDLGVSNLASIVTTTNESFIIDGKKAKSINQLYNKQIGKLNKLKTEKTFTKKQILILRKRNLRIEDYFNKAARMIINLAQEKQVKEIVIGYNKGMKNYGINNDNISKKSKSIINQSYIGLPIFRLKNKIISLAERNNITVILIDEAYTSICSFYDFEKLAYSSSYLGQRKGRLFYTKIGKIVNADINAALNILRKYKTDNDEDVCRLRSSGPGIPLRLNVLNI